METRIGWRNAFFEFTGVYLRTPQGGIEKNSSAAKSP